MRITIVGHLVIDEFEASNIQINSLGGPPSYAGLTAKNLGAEITLLTKFGTDLPEYYFIWLIRNQIKIGRDSRSTTHPTTRFRIVQTPEGRELYLKSRCEDLKNFENWEGDAVIISPVAGEVGLAFLNHVRRRFKTVYLDPQGFIRKFHPSGHCRLTRIDRHVLENADIIKMDNEEAMMITGKRDPFQALEDLEKMGVRVGVYTNGKEGVLLRCDEGVFKIPVSHQGTVVDMTGVGDIFAGAFTVEYLQTGDPVWSGCVAVAAASGRLDRFGLSKILEIEKIIDSAKEIAGNVIRISQA
jgi:sugar/nucleoside kinase (ribokinase family)